MPSAAPRNFATLARGSEAIPNARPERLLRGLRAAAGPPPLRRGVQLGLRSSCRTPIALVRRENPVLSNIHKSIACMAFPARTQSHQDTVRAQPMRAWHPWNGNRASGQFGAIRERLMSLSTYSTLAIQFCFRRRRRRFSLSPSKLADA